jgi:MraZ protein
MIMSEVRASYTDSYAHSFDDKGRITVPAEWREEPFEKSLIIFPSKEKCLRVYPASWLGRLQDSMASLRSSDPVRQALEDLATSAQSTALDAQGRIVVKAHLRESAGLSPKAKVMFVGRVDHFQIWDEEQWKKKAPKPATFEETLATIGR